MVPPLLPSLIAIIALSSSRDKIFATNTFYLFQAAAAIKATLVPMSPHRDGPPLLLIQQVVVKIDKSSGPSVFMITTSRTTMLSQLYVSSGALHHLKVIIIGIIHIVHISASLNIDCQPLVSLSPIILRGVLVRWLAL